MIGETIAHFRITAKLGEGGMGEVYRATDTKLGREVALKILPEQFAQNADRMARFQREAQVLASLNHPNIAAIYGVEERALVMELIEGQTLPCPLPVDVALAYAKQIAEALEYAHERGIIHRDLKPANIKVTSDGVVKVLDFGLAKAVEEPGLDRGDPSVSPTLTLGQSQMGVVMGTAAYMAPEQAAGAKVDRRADIWSFGAVLYEMLSGKRAFGGDSIADTLASVMKLDPDWSALPQKAPASIHKLMRRCLTRDRKQRLQAIGEARIVLESPLRDEPAPALAHTGSRVPWMIAAAFALIAIGLGLSVWRSVQAESPHVTKLSFPPPEKGTFPPGGYPGLAVSPDGRHVAFEAIVGGRPGLWLRDLDSLVPRMLAPLGNSPEVPFWAPDSRRVAFFDGGTLRKIDITGGPPVTVVERGHGLIPGSGSWNQEDVIIFDDVTGILRVPAAGGSPTSVTQFDQTRAETVHTVPWFLPDGRHFLYLAGSIDPERSRVYVGDLASTTRKEVIGFGTRAIYVAPGYLLFVHDRILMAQPFDAGKLATTGDAVPVVEQVDVTRLGNGNMGYFSASQSGTLAYTSGSVGGRVQLTWFDRSGKKLDTAGAPANVQWFSLSPDASAVAFTRADPQTGRFDLWNRDLAHGSESRLTFNGSNRYPVWSSDGTHIFFVSNRHGTDQVCEKAADGTGPEEVLESSSKFPTDASRDGRYLLTETGGSNPKTGNDVWVLPLFGDRKPFPYVQTEFREARPRLSPDGRWLAYESDESKRLEIYVISFPQPGGKWQISIDGGAQPAWSRDGRELYYYSLTGKIMAVDIQSSTTPNGIAPTRGSRTQFQFGVPKALFDVRMSTSNTSMDVSKDGRFLLPALVEQDVSIPMTVVLNWPAMLKKK